jgi:hypothetical protein
MLHCGMIGTIVSKNESVRSGQAGMPPIIGPGLSAAAGGITIPA